MKSIYFFFFKQKTAYEMRISDWSSDVCSSDLVRKSTWADPEINADVPYYHRLDWLHDHAREMPLTPKLAEMSHIVDDMLTAAVTGDAPTAELLAQAQARAEALARSEEHTSELQSLMRTSYAVFCFKKKKQNKYN